MSALRRVKEWFVADDQDDMARMKAARDLAVREAVHAEAQARALCEALDLTDAQRRELDRMAEHYRRGWQMGAPFVEYDERLVHPSFDRSASTN